MVLMPSNRPSLGIVREEGSRKSSVGGYISDSDTYMLGKLTCRKSPIVIEVPRSVKDEPNPQLLFLDKS